jgi:hypothetical protein
MEWLADLQINGIDFMLLAIIMLVDHRRYEWKKKCQSLLK